MDRVSLRSLGDDKSIPKLRLAHGDPGTGRSGVCKYLHISENELTNITSATVIRCDIRFNSKRK